MPLNMPSETIIPSDASSDSVYRRPVSEKFYKILIVDDDKHFRDTLGAKFEAQGEFEVCSAATAISFIEHCEITSNWDVVLLDVSLPDMDGREACKIIRRKGINVPLIMLNVEASDVDVILGLDAGANDYVTKPVKFPVLLARIRAQLRQHVNRSGAVISLGPYDFVPSQKMLFKKDGSKIRLTEKETALLRFLRSSMFNHVTRDVIVRSVWGQGADIHSHTLETHIYRLRQKIEPDPARVSILLTEAGSYRLCR